jgi:recombinational DNA repair protein (RecF pathway)
MLPLSFVSRDGLAGLGFRVLRCAHCGQDRPAARLFDGEVCAVCLRPVDELSAVEQRLSDHIEAATRRAIDRPADHTHSGSDAS